MENVEVVKTFMEAAGYKASLYHKAHPMNGMRGEVVIVRQRGPIGFMSVLNIEGTIIKFIDDNLHSCREFNLCSPTSIDDILEFLKKCLKLKAHYSNGTPTNRGCKNCRWCPNG